MTDSEAKVAWRIVIAALAVTAGLLAAGIMLPPDQVVARQIIATVAFPALLLAVFLLPGCVIHAGASASGRSSRKRQAP